MMAVARVYASFRSHEALVGCVGSVRKGIWRDKRMEHQGRKCGLFASAKRCILVRSPFTLE